MTTDPVDRTLLREINETRRAHGVRALRPSSGLDRAATTHSRDMARRGYFSHTGTPGVSFTRAIRLTYPARGYRTWHVGQNLFWSVSVPDARTIVRAWLRSPPHRKILLRREWRDVGIGAVRSTSAPRFYRGRPVTIVTLDVGVRR